MSYFGRMAFDLEEKWVFHVRLVDAAGDPLTATGTTAYTVIRVRGGADVLTLTSATVVAVAATADDEAHTLAVFTSEDEDRLDDDDARLLAERVYEFECWAILGDGSRFNQNAGSLTLY